MKSEKQQNPTFVSKKWLEKSILITIMIMIEIIEIMDHPKYIN